MSRTTQQEIEKLNGQSFNALLTKELQAEGLHQGRIYSTDKKNGGWSNNPREVYKDFTLKRGDADDANCSFVASRIDHAIKTTIMSMDIDQKDKKAFLAKYNDYIVGNPNGKFGEGHHNKTSYATSGTDGYVAAAKRHGDLEMFKKGELKASDLKVGQHLVFQPVGHKVKGKEFGHMATVVADPKTGELKIHEFGIHGTKIYDVDKWLNNHKTRDIALVDMYKDIRDKKIDLTKTHDNKVDVPKKAQEIQKKPETPKTNPLNVKVVKHKKEPHEKVVKETPKEIHKEIPKKLPKENKVVEIVDKNKTEDKLGEVCKIRSKYHNRNTGSTNEFQLSQLKKHDVDMVNIPGIGQVMQLSSTGHNALLGMGIHEMYAFTRTSRSTDLLNKSLKKGKEEGLKIKGEETGLPIDEFHASEGKKYLVGRVVGNAKNAVNNNSVMSSYEHKYLFGKNKVDWQSDKDGYSMQNEAYKGLYSMFNKEAKGRGLNADGTLNGLRSTSILHKHGEKAPEGKVPRVNLGQGEDKIIYLNNKPVMAVDFDGELNCSQGMSILYNANGNFPPFVAFRSLDLADKLNKERVDELKDDGIFKQYQDMKRGDLSKNLNSKKWTDLPDDVKDSIAQAIYFEKTDGISNSIRLKHGEEKMVILKAMEGFDYNLSQADFNLHKSKNRLWTKDDEALTKEVLNMPSAARKEYMEKEGLHVQWHPKEERPIVVENKYYIDANNVKRLTAEVPKENQYISGLKDVDKKNTPDANYMTEVKPVHKDSNNNNTSGGGGGGHSPSPSNSSTGKF